MNNNKVVLGVICGVIAAGIIYSQAPPSNQINEGEGTELLEEANNGTLSSTTDIATSQNSAIESTLLTLSQQGLGENNTDVKAVASVSSQAKISVLKHSHQKPADHQSASQPKAHGHENQRRHPEDNSLIPPGEPKKPVLNSNNNG